MRLLPALAALPIVGSLIAGTGEAQAAEEDLHAVVADLQIGMDKLVNGNRAHLPQQRVSVAGRACAAKGADLRIMRYLPCVTAGVIGDSEVNTVYSPFVEFNVAQGELDFGSEQEWYATVSALGLRRERYVAPSRDDLRMTSLTAASAIGYRDRDPAGKLHHFEFRTGISTGVSNQRTSRDLVEGDGSVNVNPYTGSVRSNIDLDRALYPKSLATRVEFGWVMGWAF